MLFLGNGWSPRLGNIPGGAPPVMGVNGSVPMTPTLASGSPGGERRFASTSGTLAPSGKTLVEATYGDGMTPVGNGGPRRWPL
jgi:hypothetical protein